MNRRAFHRQSITLLGLSIIGQYSCKKDEIPANIDLHELDTQHYLQNSTMRIRWSYQAIENINIDLISNGDKLQSIVMGLPVAQEEYEWTINAPTGLFSIRISDSQHQGVFNESDPFEVIESVVFDLNQHPALILPGSQLSTSKFGIGDISIRRIDEHTFEVLNLSCPHNGCLVEFSESSHQFQCPCHGSKFTGSGCLVNGPATENLTTYETVYDLKNNLLIVGNPENNQPC